MLPQYILHEWYDSDILIYHKGRISHKRWANLNSKATEVDCQADMVVAPKQMIVPKSFPHWKFENNTKTSHLDLLLAT